MAEPPIPLGECVRILAIVIYTIPRINRSEKVRKEEAKKLLGPNNPAFVLLPIKKGGESLPDP
jgi:hypothetical protein